MLPSSRSTGEASRISPRADGSAKPHKSPLSLWDTGGGEGGGRRHDIQGLSFADRQSFPAKLSRDLAFVLEPAADDALEAGAALRKAARSIEILLVVGEQIDMLPLQRLAQELQHASSYPAPAVR